MSHVGVETDVSKNNGTPKSSILIGCSIINHPFWGTIIFGNTQTDLWVIRLYEVMLVAIRYSFDCVRVRMASVLYKMMGFAWQL